MYKLMKRYPNLGGTKLRIEPSRGSKPPVDHCGDVSGCSGRKRQGQGPVRINEQKKSFLSEEKFCSSPKEFKIVTSPC